MSYSSSSLHSEKTSDQLDLLKSELSLLAAAGVNMITLLSFVDKLVELADALRDLALDDELLLHSLRLLLEVPMLVASVSEVLELRAVNELDISFSGCA